MSIGLSLLLFLAAVMIGIGIAFIIAWHKSPSNYEGASSPEIAQYLRRSDRNALLGVLFVFWGVAAAIIVYCVLSVRPG